MRLLQGNNKKDGIHQRQTVAAWIKNKPVWGRVPLHVLVISGKVQVPGSTCRVSYVHKNMRVSSEHKNIRASRERKGFV